jgi:hypothetical protein
MKRKSAPVRRVKPTKPSIEVTEEVKLQVASHSYGYRDRIYRQNATLDDLRAFEVAVVSQFGRDWNGHIQINHGSLTAKKSS